MKVKLRARRLWNAIDTDNEEDDMLALEAILVVVPAEYREPLGAKKSEKKATAQLLKEYANLKFRDGEMVEDFSLRL
jgi:hypothetical protein